MPSYDAGEREFVKVYCTACFKGVRHEDHIDMVLYL